MTKIIIQKNKKYSVINNTALRDKRLSARSKGIYAYIMTLPDEWQIYKDELYTHFSEGRDALNKAFNELVDLGYIIVTQTKEKGKFSSNDYTILDEPVDGEPFTEKPLTENPTLLITDELITDKFKEKINKKETRHKHGEYKHVLLTDAQYKELLDLWGESKLKASIKNLDEYIETTGKSYKNHKLVLTKWDRSSSKIKYPEGERNFTVESREWRGNE